MQLPVSKRKGTTPPSFLPDKVRLHTVEPFLSPASPTKYHYQHHCYMLSNYTARTQVYEFWSRATDGAPAGIVCGAHGTVFITAKNRCTFGSTYTVHAAFRKLETAPTSSYNASPMKLPSTRDTPRKSYADGCGGRKTLSKTEKKKTPEYFVLTMLWTQYSASETLPSVSVMRWMEYLSLIHI